MKLHNKPIKLYNYQKRWLKDPAEFRIANKARQIGVTQICALEALVYALANENELIGIISVSERQAKDVIEYIRNAYLTLPDELRLKLLVDSKQEMKWENNSRILSLPNNPRTIRGKAYTRLYLDELAHYQQDKEIMDAAMPAVSRGGLVSYISTPLGKQGEFHRIWDETDNDTVSHHEIPYTECPDIIPRINLIKSTMDEERFKQEYTCMFLDETTSMFPYALLKSVWDEKLENKVPIGTKNPLYVGVDYGKKIDSTVTVAVEDEPNIMTLCYINEFKPPLKYTDVSKFLLRNSPNWGTTKMNIDQTGVGERMIEDLQDLGSVVQGENLSRPFKEKIIQNLKILMQDGKIRIPKNDTLINQLHALKKTITDSGVVSYKHPTSGKIQHDDYVWALALAVWGAQSGSSAGTKPIILPGNVMGVKKRRSFGSSRDY